MDIKTSYENALAKASKTSYFVDHRQEKHNSMAQNPYTEVSYSLTPLEFTIYTWIIEWNKRYQRGGVVLAEAPIQTFDRMRYYFRDLNYTAYMDMLD